MGGVERVRVALAREFVNRGIRTEFLLLQSGGELVSELPKGCELRSLNVGRIREAWRPLHRYLRDSRPDALLAAMWPLTGIACAAIRSSGSKTRLVVSEHNDFRCVPAINRKERWFLKMFGRQIYSWSDGVVAVSNGVRESLIDCVRLTKEEVLVINNPITISGNVVPELDDVPHFEWWGCGEFRLLAVGTLKPQKGFDTLLKAVSLLREHIEPRLIIVGEGVIRDELRKLMLQLGIEDLVRFVGLRTDPGPFMAAADLFVLSSNWEGFGNVLVEALAYGTPIVSADCRSGPREILSDGIYGSLVPPGEPQALAEAIRKHLIASHDIEALCERARSFGIEKATDAYMQLLFPEGGAIASC